MLSMPDVLPEWGDVRLRPFEPRDVEMVMDLATDPYVPLISTLAAGADRRQAGDWLDRQGDRLVDDVGYPFCIAHRRDDRALGAAGLWTRGLYQGRATAGYVVASRERGRGVARQPLTALGAFGWPEPARTAQPPARV